MHQAFIQTVTEDWKNLLLQLENQVCCPSILSSCLFIIHLCSFIYLSTPPVDLYSLLITLAFFLFIELTESILLYPIVSRLIGMLPLNRRSNV